MTRQLRSFRLQKRDAPTPRAHALPGGALRAALGPLALLVALSLAGRSARAQFPPVTILDQGPSSGKVYFGSGAVRGAGRSIAWAGDANGDGKPDLLIAAITPQETLPGRVYLVPGRRETPWMQELVGGLNGVIEIRAGGAAADRLGRFVAAAGDVDGDGFDDFLIGAPEGEGAGSSGGVYLVFGAASLPAFLDLSVTPSSRAVLLGTSGAAGGLGIVGCGAGDIDGDGLGDIALGIPGGAEPGGGGPQSTAGKVWIVFGSPGLRGGSRTILLDELPASAALQVGGASEGDALGAAVCGAGDLDGDGFEDLLIGAPGRGVGGSVYIIFGRGDFTSSPDVASPDGSSVVELASSFGPARIGESLAGGLDATGDGRPDLAFGAPAAEREGQAAGLVVLEPGGPGLRGSASRAVPSAGSLRFRGVQGSETGAAVALVPDADGDGIADIIVGAPGVRAERGAAYLIRGGLETGRDVLLEQIVPPDGWSFATNLPGVRLGSSVAGLPDRSGDLLGELVIGAPQTGKQGLAGTGAAFEVFLPVDPDSPAPRNLTATLLAGQRVRLNWMIARKHAFLRVLRDGDPLGPPLPGRALGYVDVGPEPGRHVYVVEADGDAALRSNQAEVEVRSIPVQDLRCEQAEEGEVIVTWTPGDLYESLQVLVDGEPASGLLPPEVRRFEIELSPGEHAIEVFDPAQAPGGARARCVVSVQASERPEIEDFTCTADGPRLVRLSWRPEEEYRAYAVARNGFALAIVEGATELIDAGVPPGAVRYEVRGLDALSRRGPPASCDVQVAREGDLLVRGRVTWRRGAAVRSGSVHILRVGDGEVFRAQLSQAGEFEAPVPEPGAYRVRYDTAVDLRGIEQGVWGRQELRVEVDAIQGGETLLEIPPPVVLAAALGPDRDQGPGPARWDALRASVGTRTLTFARDLRGGVARGAVELRIAIDEILAVLSDRLGSAPHEVDIVAHGAAGLAARVALVGLEGIRARKLFLLGTPGLGTTRAEVEARGEFGARPPRGLQLGQGPSGGSPPGRTREFTGAVEQTSRFLAGLRGELPAPEGTEVHLLAGTSGRAVLDGVLGCDVHDDRVCAESALGGVPGGVPHTVRAIHETLGRGSASIAVILDGLFGGAGGGGGGVSGAGEGAALPVEFEPPDSLEVGDAAVAELVDGEDGTEDAAGGGGEIIPSYSTGSTYVGVLEPGSTGILPLVSDTSESIIIILNTDLPGGIRLQIELPSGRTVEPADAGALDFVEYQTYGDGEGHDIQVFRFAPCETGIYLARITNPNGFSIPYALEAYVAGDFEIELAVSPEEALPGEPARLFALLWRKGLPETGLSVTASVARPDGALALLDLRDDGSEADDIAGDGVYSAEIPPSDQPGIHQIVATAIEPGPLFATVEREAVGFLRIWSEAAAFTGEYVSGTEDHDDDDVLDRLWIDVGVASPEGGDFLAMGRLTDLEGDPVATAGIFFRLQRGESTTFRLYFMGGTIFAAQRDGPFRLAEVTLLDGNAGFVPADRQTNVHTTAALPWATFGLALGPRFIRADANADGTVDISDGIAILRHLFLGATIPPCRNAIDANDDAKIDLSDASYIFLYLFRGGESIPAPFPECGTGGQLDCEVHAPCAP